MSAQKISIGPDEYLTRHLALASFLILQGCKLDRVESETRGNGLVRKAFVFQEKKRCTTLAFEYHETPFAMFYNKIQDLKKML